MSLVVNHNMMAMNAARNLTTVYSNLAQSTARLSSGLRVNSAADDAAGLAVRELMRADIAVLNQGVRNASDAISMLQTAEGAMSVIDEKLIRMKELAEQAATGTYTTAQRAIMDSEYQAMAAEIDRIANATDFNGINLLNGDLATDHSGSGMKIHFGTGNDSTEDYYYVKINKMTATDSDGLRVGGGANTAEVWQTDGVAAASATASVNASGSTQVFGIFYSTTTDASDNPEINNFFGYVSVADGDSLQDVVDSINDGSRATASEAITFATGFSNDVITVNGVAVTFATANDDNALGTTTATVGVGGINSATSVALSFASLVNNNSDTFGVWASTDGATVSFSAVAGGTSGNSIAIGKTSTSMMTSSVTMAGGGSFASLTASAESTSSGYELKIAYSSEGTQYQFQIFTPDYDTTNSVFGDVISGTNGTTVHSQFGTLRTAVSTSTTADTVTAWAYGDTDAEWTELSSGSSDGATWNGAHILTQSAAQAALGGLSTAIETKDAARAALGSLQNRLENTITNLQIQAENLQSAESRISDVDVALEMTEFTRNNILAQSAVAMLAQANSLPMLALSLMG